MSQTHQPIAPVPAQAKPHASSTGVSAPTFSLSASLATTWIAGWMILLAGLAIGGKGVAYIGLHPIYITELVLVSGGFILLLQPNWLALLKIPTVPLMLALIALGLARTLPFLSQYKVDALRDGVLYGYSGFALIVAGIVISQPAILPWILRKYRGFARVFLLFMPFWITLQLINGGMDFLPWVSESPLLDLNPGDAPVHLGGIVAFAIVGLFRPEFMRMPKQVLAVLWPLLALLLVAITGAVTRGGLVAFGLASTAAITMRPNNKWAMNAAVAVLIILPALLLIDPKLPVPGRQREFSARQFIINVTSIVGSSRGEGDLDGTKEWRLQWWSKIIDYTFHGEYFWQGKGFGVNLADSDGFQVEFDDSPLRSPHNGHLTILARMGVPGFALWIGIQLTWLYAMLNAYVRARQRSHVTWMMLFVFLVGYWFALNFNAAFDVYFEGPMGGAWFWSVIGFGLAAAWVYERQPELLSGEEFEVRH